MPFTTLGLDRRLLDAVAALGYEKPTPIQSDAIPPALAGRDLLACAATGSGKSAAFLLPILQRLLGGPRGRVRVLVLTPTRELAAQIDQSRRDLGKLTGLTGAAVYGGVGMGPQETALRKGVDILVATPGRLLDHLQSSYAKLDQVEIVVLDEADRMLDMGFLPDVRKILARLPAQRQTLFFSATMPAEIAKLSREILRDPVAIQIERRSAPAHGITQAVWPVAQELKTALLFELLNRGELENALVFTRTKHRANRVADWLEKRGVNAARIHGNRSQAQRTEALAGFKAGKYRVLVATDVASRGIDIEALPHVVNFDVPAEPDSYIHRVGRTARAEREGDAWTFVSREEEGDLRAIERAVGKPIPRRTLDGFDYTKRAEEKLEIPVQERIAAIRAKKAEDRQRAAAKAARKAGGAGAPAQRASSSRPAARPAHGAPARPGERPARQERPAAGERRGPARPAHATHETRGSHRRPSSPAVPWWQRRDA
ncbi:MAG: DEAD/DEAH box helicase [Thermoanaerobaculia bacterium]|nr:DEAD/DEAH box helicase [Thermoanaerobaculia bacterium]